MELILTLSLLQGISRTQIWHNTLKNWEKPVLIPVSDPDTKHQVILMLYTNHKVGLFNPAEKLSKVSKACKTMSISHDTFYRYREADEENALIHQRPRVLDIKNGLIKRQNRLLLLTLLLSQRTDSTAWTMHCLNRAFLSPAAAFALSGYATLLRTQKATKSTGRKVTREGIPIAPQIAELE